MTPQNRILIIDDEIPICRFLKESLKNSYEVQAVHNLHEGQQLTIEYRPHLIILDLNLQNEDGLVYLKNLREWSAIPVIVLSARTNELNIISALDLGANDYLTKPFSVLELAARIRATLRSTNSDFSTSQINFGNLRVFTETHQVFINEQEVHLTKTEYDLLMALAKNQGKVVTHQKLLLAVWGPHSTEQTQYLRVYMGQLRKKLKAADPQFDLIQTEPGVGYRLR